MSADPVPFSWRNPDYTMAWAARDRRLKFLHENPAAVPEIMEFYRSHPAEFINDWGCVAEPRNVQRGLDAITPFLLFPRQYECVDWIMERWRNEEPGIVEKSRDSGMTWLTVALACTLCLFQKNMVVGFGSRKVEYVDALGQPRSIFEKARLFLSWLPLQFLGGWTLEKDAPYMRISFPATGSVIVGEGGDSIGRGDRTSMYIIDESAFLEHPEKIDAALSATTPVRLDVSTPNGTANSFYQRRSSGQVKVFTFHWRDDPRKGPEWYSKQQRDLDPTTLASEVDINYRASIERQVIPAAWIESAIDAHVALGIHPSGMRYASLDVADTGKDLNCFAGRYGFLLQHLQSWSGRNSDIYTSVVRAINLCDEWGYESFLYDGDGLGAGCRGDARMVNEAREAIGKAVVNDSPFRGSAAVYNPEGSMVTGKKNKDHFLNMKAQSYWALRLRFQAVHRWRTEGIEPKDPDSIISISRDLPELNALVNELSQPTYITNQSGKLLVDKKPDGAMSPNLADAAMICFSPETGRLELWARLGE